MSFVDNCVEVQGVESTMALITIILLATFLVFGLVIPLTTFKTAAQTFLFVAKKSDNEGTTLDRYWVSSGTYNKTKTPPAKKDQVKQKLLLNFVLYSISVVIIILSLIEKVFVLTLSRSSVWANLFFGIGVVFQVVSEYPLYSLLTGIYNLVIPSKETEIPSRCQCLRNRFVLLLCLASSIGLVIFIVIDGFVFGSLMRNHYASSYIVLGISSGIIMIMSILIIFAVFRVYQAYTRNQTETKNTKGTKDEQPPLLLLVMSTVLGLRIFVLVLVIAGLCLGPYTNMQSFPMTNLLWVISTIIYANIIMRYSCVNLSATQLEK